MSKQRRKNLACKRKRAYEAGIQQAARALMSKTLQEEFDFLNNMGNLTNEQSRRFRELLLDDSLLPLRLSATKAKADKLKVTYNLRVT